MTFKRSASGPITTLARYGVVGLLVAGIYIVALNLFELAEFAPPVANSAVAFVIAVVFQYVAHSAYTFNRPLKNKMQVARFATTVAVGLIFSSLFVGYIGPTFRLSTFASSVIVVIMLPIFNFILFGLWVFVDKDRRIA